MSHPFIFTDESGVVETDPLQPYFGIGLLKLERVGRWNHELNKLLDQAISAQAAAGGGKGRRFEFKFNRINRATYDHYERLIDYFIAQPDAYFNALIVDKALPNFSIGSTYETSWEALLGYSYQVIDANILAGERAIVISDNYQKPANASQHYEDYLLQHLGSKILNVMMAESTSSMLLQLVDVLLGSVMYHYKRAQIPMRNVYKDRIANRLAAAYPNRTDLRGAWTCPSNPNYFSVSPFAPGGTP